MGRNPRTEAPGAIYHVFTRSNAGERIFRDVLDARAFLLRLGLAVDRFAWLCRSFCVLGTHYHLCLETPEPNLAAGMHFLNRSYAQRLNERYGRSGHVFDGPYGIKAIASDEQLLQVARYIALNPVRAGVCDHPVRWPWASFPSTLGRVPKPPWLADQPLLALFGGRIRRYREFVEGELGRALSERRR